MPAIGGCPLGEVSGSGTNSNVNPSKRQHEAAGYGPATIGERGKTSLAAAEVVSEKPRDRAPVISDVLHGAVPKTNSAAR